MANGFQAIYNSPDLGRFSYGFRT